MSKKIDYHILKLEKQCDFRRKRSGIPWNFYHKKIYYISDILEETSKKIKNKRILEEIYKQQVVSLVTALEVYLREMFIFIIDEKNIKSDKVLESIKREYSLLDVIGMHNLINKHNLNDKNKWKPAYFLANEYNFQNLDGVKTAYKKLLGIDIFAKLKNYKFEAVSGEICQLDKDFDVKIKEILELRHSIIHDINFRKKLSYEKVISIFNYLHFFVDTFDAYMEEKYKVYE